MTTFTRGLFKTLTTPPYFHLETSFKLYDVQRCLNFHWCYIFLEKSLYFFEIFNFIHKCYSPLRIHGANPQIRLHFPASLLWHTLSQKRDLNVKKLTLFSTLSWFKRYSNALHGFSAVALGRTSVFEKKPHLGSLFTLAQSARGTRRAIGNFWENCPHGQTIQPTRMLFCIFVAARVLSHTMSSPQHMDKQKLKQSQRSDIGRMICQAFLNVKF